MKKWVFAACGPLMLVMAACGGGEAQESGSQAATTALPEPVAPQSVSPEPAPTEESTTGASPVSPPLTPTEVSKEPESDPSACLSVRPLPVKLRKGVDQYGFSSSGDDVFVEVRFELTNNCDQPVKGIKGEVSITDLFESPVINGNFQETIQIPVGKTVKTESGNGYFVSQFDNWYQSLLDANEDDLTVTYTPVVTILKDGTRLSDPYN